MRINVKCCDSYVQESTVHGFLFWIGVSVLQLENEQLFETGLALIEQNLHILDSHGVFDQKVRQGKTNGHKIVSFVTLIRHITAAKGLHDGYSGTNRGVVLPQYGWRSWPKLQR